MKQNDWIFFVPPVMLMLVFMPILIPVAIAIYAAWMIIKMLAARNDRVAHIWETIDSHLPRNESRSYLLLFAILVSVVVFAFGFCFGWPNR